MQGEEKARLERVGEHYDSEMMLLVRHKTRAAIDQIAAAIRPGTTEEAATECARNVLRDAQMLRGWHGIQIRFGPNTLKPFGAPSDPGVALQDHDIFFIDIGPVWQKWEGDGGETFVVGDDPDMCRAAREVRLVFDRVREKWLADGASGQALYRLRCSQLTGKFVIRNRADRPDRYTDMEPAHAGAGARVGAGEDLERTKRREKCAQRG